MSSENTVEEWMGCPSCKERRCDYLEVLPPNELTRVNTPSGKAEVHCLSCSAYYTPFHECECLDDTHQDGKFRRSVQRGTHQKWHLPAAQFPLRQLTRTHDSKGNKMWLCEACLEATE